MEDFEDLIAYHGGDDNPFVKRLKGLLCTFSEEAPRLPFGRWQQVDPVQGSRLQDDLHGSGAEDHGAGGVAASLVRWRLGGLVITAVRKRALSSRTIGWAEPHSTNKIYN